MVARIFKNVKIGRKIELQIVVVENCKSIWYNNYNQPIRIIKKNKTKVWLLAKSIKVLDELDAE